MKFIRIWNHSCAWLKSLVAMVYHIFYSLRNRWDVSKLFVKNYIIEMHYYLYVCEAFAIFVIINGGIVVGDKGAHEAVVHLPQMLYFFLFTVVFCAPYFILLVAPFLNWLKNNLVMAVACIVVCALVIHYNSLVHPYLLADNRHYAFYIWKYLFEKNLYFRYLLIPVYVYGGYCVTFFLHEYSFAYKFAYLICVFLILVPQKLLEFRYFILPFIIFRLNVYPKFYWQLVMEFFIYIVINMATVNLFLTREICWDDMYDVQRFMW